MERQKSLDHVTLALADSGHVDGDVPGPRAVPRAIMYEVSDLGAPDLVLAGEAVDVGAGTADVSPLDHGCPMTRLRHVPGEKHAAISAAEDQRFKSFWLGHRHLRLRPKTHNLARAATVLANLWR